MKTYRIILLKLILSICACFILQPAFADTTHYFPRPEIYRQILTLLKNRYVDPTKIVPQKMLSAALEKLSLIVNPLIYDLDEKSGKLHIRLNKAVFDRTLQSDFNVSLLQLLLEDISLFVKQNYDGVSYGTIDVTLAEGVISTLDPHTVYFKKKDFNRFMKETSGSYQGVGMVITLKDKLIVVDKIFDGSPAKKAGLKKSDIITQVNGRKTKGLSTQEVSELLLGEKNTRLDIVIGRTINGKIQPFSFQVIRKKIEISSVESKEFSSKTGRVGYVRISAFQENTYRDLDTKLDEMNIDLNDFKGIILDLRNNPGGYLDQAISVSNKFLTEGMIVYVATINNVIRKFYEATPYNTIEDIPIIALINEDSASAAEIVAAALKKNNRAVLIGRKTFGKGSVQDVFNLQDGSAIKVTDSKYLTPEKISIQSRGVSPHILIDYLMINKDSFYSSKIGQNISESQLENNFSEWGNEFGSSEFAFEYDKTGTDNANNQKPNENTGKKNNDTNLSGFDFELNFANQILMSYKGQYNFKNLLQHALQLSKSEKNSQQKNIQIQLENTGIEWDYTKNAEVPPALHISTSKQDNKPGDEFVFESDQELFIKIEVENKSAKKLPPMFVVLSGEHLPFRQKHIPVGNIYPGKQKIMTVPVKFNTSVVSLPVLIKSFLYDLSGKKITETSQKILITNNNSDNRLKVKLSTFVLKQKPNSPSTWFKRIGMAVQVEDLVNKSKEYGDLYFDKQADRLISVKKADSSLGKEKDKNGIQNEYVVELIRKPAEEFIDLTYYLKGNNLLNQPIANRFKIPYNQAAYEFENIQPLISVKNSDQINYVTDKTTYNLDFTASDDEKWNEITVFHNRKKILYELNEQNEKTKDISVSNISLLPNDFNTFQIIVRDNKNMTAVYEYTLLQKSY